MALINQWRPQNLAAKWKPKALPKLTGTLLVKHINSEPKRATVLSNKVPALTVAAMGGRLVSSAVRSMLAHGTARLATRTTQE